MAGRSKVNPESIFIKTDGESVLESCQQLSLCLDASLQDYLHLFTLPLTLEADFGYAVHMVDGGMLQPQLWQFLGCSSCQHSPL